MFKQNELSKNKPTDDLLKAELFPDRFDFFHLGVVRAVKKASKLSEIGNSPFIVTFRLTGDELGFCAVGFERAPINEDQASLMIEMANILIAKFATQTAEILTGSVELSPPEVLQTHERRQRYLVANLKTATQKPQNGVLRTYEFVATNNEPSTPARCVLRVAYLPNQTGES